MNSSLRSRLLVAAVLSLSGAIGPVLAQAPGIPVYGGGFSPTFELQGQLAFPTADASTGDGLVVGATGTVAVGRLGVWATAGQFFASEDGASDRLVYGAMAGLKVLGGPLSPLGLYLQGGIGGMEDDDPNATTLHVPLAVAATLTIPTPYVSIRPWLAPRADVTLLTTNGETESGRVWGMSAGVDLTLITGWSFRASYDKLEDVDGTVGLGVAVHF